MASSPSITHIAMEKVRQEVLFRPQMRIHLAHCLMLRKQGIISDQVANALLGELLTLIQDESDIVTTNYLHLEQHLISVLGVDIAGQLHTARSRNDLGATAWRLVLRELILNVQTHLLELRATIAQKASEHVETVMPGYSHSKHAQPITLGYYLAAFGDVLARDYRRINAAYLTNNRSPLGAAALTTTGFPIDRFATADYLGFAGLMENGLDAVASRDDAEESACALAVLGAHLARIAEDLFIWNTLEFDFITFNDSITGGSSIMPQKKNPGFLETIKMNAGHLIGTATQVLAATRGAWFTDAGDGKNAGNDPLLLASDSASTCMRLLSDALQNMQIHEDRMATLARTGFGTMTEVADTIVRESGRSFRMAHSIVSKTVDTTLQLGKQADEITPAMLDATSVELFGEPLGIDHAAISKALDPAENIRLRTITGGPAPSEMHRMLGERLAALNEDTNQHNAERSRLAECQQGLLAEANSVAHRV